MEPPVTAQVVSRTDGEIAVLTIDHPPVNALSHAVRSALVDGLAKAKADPAIKAVVIAGAGRLFSAGADITEFGKPPQSPNLRELIATVEAVGKPVVAAVHGTTLGGGFELALGCHFRVAAPGARVGLPEIKLGLLPGAGGTQRLPRLVGPEKALRWIIAGEAIPAETALADGIVDTIASGDVVTEAIGFARRCVADSRPLRLVRDREEKLASARADAKAFDEAAAALTKRSAGQRAPAACVESVRNAFKLPFAEGDAREMALFRELVVSDQSKAQRHVFFAEREAAKVAGMPADTKPRAVERAAVIGAGTMGGGIAMCFANAGIPVALVETTEEALTRGLDTIKKNYASTVARGGLTAAEAERRVGLIAGGVGLERVRDADMVIEAVFEEMDLKQRIFGELDRLAKPGAVLATNTSTLDVNVIARATKRPQDVLGMHFFSPANVMRLLEIVRAEATAHDALASAVAVARKIAKVPVVVGVCDGFVGNRMLARRSAEMERLILEGAAPHDVDAAILGFGFPMGPFAMSDLAGLDVGWRIRRARGIKAAVSDALCEAGRYGQKTGKGYFLYEKGSRTPIPDPEVDALIADTAKRLGIERRVIAKDEIVERMIYPMINEGARILEEGIAARPGDIDVIWVYGYGWPAWRGGPMHYANAVGLAKIAERLAAYAARSGDQTLAPAPLLARLAADGKGFG
jgi:3-hydroxyacyl-CoA dehydrogenase